jgi:sugar lactone lactonase YvrE
MPSIRSRFALGLVILLALSLPAWSAAPQAFKWSVQYLIDNSQSVFGRSQEVYPRANRGLAISPDGNFLYASYVQSFNSGEPLRPRDSRMTNTGEVRKIDLRIADYEDATRVVLPYHRAKSIAVDDQGRVYLAEGNMIEVYDANLKNVLLTLPADFCDGVAVTREGGDTVVYATEREAGELHRFLIDTRFGAGSAGTAAGLSGSGLLKIPGAQSLRGVAVDPKGRIWIADPEANRVFRVDSDGSNLTSIEVKKAFAIAFFDGTALVTRSTDNQIALVTLDMVVTGNLSVPWEELELAPCGNDRDGSLAGIAVIPGNKGFYVANEHGQTANQKSTYGRTDQNSQVIDGKLFTDAFQDDNEPILRAIPVVMQDANTDAAADTASATDGVGAPAAQPTPAAQVASPVGAPPTEQSAPSAPTTTSTAAAPASFPALR